MLLFFFFDLYNLYNISYSSLEIPNNNRKHAATCFRLVYIVLLYSICFRLVYILAHMWLRTAAPFGGNNTPCVYSM